MKINLRKGLFETSSSSEDSLSVYQDMELFILPIKEYDKFVNDKLYIRLDNINPSFIENIDEVLKANESFFNKAGYTNDIETLEKLSGYLLYNYRKEVYINYYCYKRMINNHFYDSNFFSYENGANMIFGYYGYTEE